MEFSELLTFKQYITELVHISDFLNKKGNDFLNDLLNSEVAVNLKIDTAALVVGKENGEIKYWGREGREEIDLDKRKLSDMWEKHISHLQTRNLDKIPEGMKIFIEFFDTKLKTLISYDVHPKNDMIISYVTQNKKIVAPDNKINIDIAKLLDIDSPPVLFSGKLSSKQKDKIIEFADMTMEDRKRKYGGKDFVEYVLSLFIPAKRLNFLLTTKLEGVVFYFKNGDKVEMAKLVDPTFTQGIIDKKNSSDDKYFPIVSKMVFSELESAFNNSVDKSSSYDILILNMTKYIMSKNKSNIKKLNVYKSSVTDNRFASIGFNLLPQSVGKLVDKEWVAEDIYRITFSLLRKTKKRANPSTGLTRDMKDKVNGMVGTLREKGLR